MTYHVNVSWTMVDTVEVEAESEEQARDMVDQTLGLPNNQRQYLDHSFRIDGVDEQEGE